MNHEEHMQRAIRLARRGAGYVEPNPPVGCVIVRGGRVVGEGWHRRFGGDHGEVHALRAAGGRARGATLYVTLEPCAHQGKTPPCTDALIAAGVKQVFIACRDPDPASGSGVRRLRRAGMHVEVGLCPAAARDLIAPFTRRVTKGLPYVMVKWAATVDGKIATGTGHSRWISGAGARRIVHRLRGRVDAVVVGIGTVKADNPLLTARDVKRRRVARRVVVDPGLQLPPGCALVDSLEEAPLMLAVGESAARRAVRKRRRLEARGVEILPLRRRADGRLDLRRLLRHLVRCHGATNVLVEGGASTLGAFVEQGYVDEVWTFTAPKLLGAAGAPSPLRVVRAGPKRMEGAQSLELMEWRRVEDDVMARYRVVR